MNVLLSAYACNPQFGGEDGFGFNWTWQTARQGHRVWCVTNPCGRAGIAEFMAQHGHEIGPNQLQFLFVAVPAWVQFLHRWQFGVYLHYWVWQYRAWRAARRLSQSVNFDYVHHATYGSLQMGSWMWRLGKPLVFGPVGGGQRAPVVFRRFIPDWFRSETMRNLVGWLLTTLDPNVRQTLRHATVVLATNSETAALARKLGARRVELFLDSGLPEDFFSPTLPVRTPKPELRLLWLGRLFPRKGLHLVLEALSKVDQGVPFHLTIIGDGPMRDRLPAQIARYGLQNHVTWRGAIPWQQVRAAYLAHDVFLFGSLRDSFASQFLEAMATGLPIITLDHQGAHDFIPAEAAVKVPVTSPAATALGLAQAIEHYYHNQAARHAAGQAGFDFARTHTWDLRAQRLQALLQEALPRPLTLPPVLVNSPTAPQEPHLARA
ncbi:glycosyltransferase family 4 protein [Hymenobacter pini]|uniref:glycosyltransferase family 4 protein n=1 Tax=Hymenobacter pini TaxID=2880879 RepID=UPI001CF22A54|nr:glycosyltransferase family 4 protein [Hymenobacter pini]MCA8829553.1 glycosyltransferase family 4 protein [Hymenobacter pini]